MIPNESGGQINFDELFEPELDEQGGGGGGGGGGSGNGPLGGGNSTMGMQRSHQQEWMNVVYMVCRQRHSIRKTC